MGADLEMEILYGGGNPYCEPEGKGVAAKWILEEALGETHDRKNMKRSGDAKRPEEAGLVALEAVEGLRMEDLEAGEDPLS